MIFSGTPEHLAKVIGGQLEEILRVEIERQMKERLKPIVEDAARTIAKNLRGSIQATTSWHEDKIHFMLRIDGLEEIVKSREDDKP